MKGLILAGTYEARLLCQALSKHDVPAIASLAGATRSPDDLGLETRIGGFGGKEGFRSFLVNNAISYVVDATHPFATVMTTTAHSVCSELGIPHLILQRDAWDVAVQSNWVSFSQVAELANIIPKEATVFLGTGRQTILDYAVLEGREIHCRVIDPPQSSFPLSKGGFIEGRPPFSVEEEKELFSKLGIDWLVVKNSGGTGGYSKFIAAKALGIQVAVMTRSALPHGAKHVAQMEEALSWIEKQ